MSGQKNKISAFEFAIMQVADPEKAKSFVPYTRDEEHDIRVKKMEDKLSNTMIKCRDKSVKSLGDCLPLTEYEKRLIK